METYLQAVVVIQTPEKTCGLVFNCVYGQLREGERRHGVEWGKVEKKVPGLPPEPTHGSLVAPFTTAAAKSEKINVCNCMIDLLIRVYLVI